MKVKRLKDEMRVIRIKEDAIRELILEKFMESGEQFFDLLDVTKVMFWGSFDMDERDLICAVYDEDKYPMQKSMDFSKIEELVPETTTSLYSGKKRYVSLKLEEIMQGEAEADADA